MSTASSAMPRARAGGRSRRSFRTMLMAAWRKRLSSRRWGAAAAASSRLSAIRLTRRRCRARCATSRRRRAAPTIVQALTTNGIDIKRVQLLGTGLWEDAQIFSNPLLDGAWYAGPDSTGFRNFSARYRSRYGRDPVRTASLAYDAVALVAALVKTQGKQRFSDEVLTNSSGFTGIDGLFRFRPDGTNQRGLAVMRVSPTGGQVISPPPKGFGGSAT